VLAAVLGWWVFSGDGRVSSAAETSEGRFRAGASIVDISPTHYPVIVNAMFTERSATGVVDRLTVRALVLEEGGVRVAMAVVDTCMMSRALIDEAKALAHRTTGIPTDRMLVSATHTHSAPSAMGCLGSRVDPRYAAYLPGRIAEAIQAANDRRAPAEVGWGGVDDWERTFNRRWIRRPDRVLNDPFGEPTVRANMHPGHESPDAIGPSGPVDPGLSVVGIRTLDGRPIAILANYSQHYYGSPLLSSDYYGRVAKYLAEGLGGEPGFVGIMSQGTSGDLMWMDYGAPRREIGYDAYAKEISDEVMAVYRGLSFQRSPGLKMAQRKVALGYRVPNAARLDWARKVAEALGDRIPQTQAEIYALEAIYLHEWQRTEVVVQALRIGELGIAAMPNEVYAITGLKVKAWSPLQRSFVMELANGGDGYIPPPEQHVLGGYTTWPARTAGLEVQAEPQILEAALQCLEEVSGRPRRVLSEPVGPYAERILADRPVAFWRLNEIVIPRAVDASGRGQDAVYEPGVALYLPGVGSGAGVSPNPALTPSRFSGPHGLNRAPHFAGGRVRSRLRGVGSEYTVSFWFWNGLTNLARPVTGYLFSRGKNGDPRVSGDHLGIGGTSIPEAAGKLFFFNGQDRDQVLVGKTYLGERTWHQVAMVRSGNRIRVYLDGRAEPEIEGEAGITGGLDDGEFFIGGRCDGFSGLEGKVDEVAVFDRALDSRVLQLQYMASGMPAPTLARRPTDSPALAPEESRSKWRVASGYRVELVASEPLTMDPVAIDWDAAGRLWVVEMADYPLGMDGEGKPGGRIRVLEDMDGDGRMDTSALFAEGLRFPNGILTWRDGVLVTAAPDILYLRDTDGDGLADKTEVLVTGFLEGNQQLRVNGLRWGLDNWVYCAAGGHHRGHASETRVRSMRVNREIAVGSRDIRFRPDTGELEPESGPTQFGRNRDDWGHWFGTQNSWPLWHYVLSDRYLGRNPHVAAPDPVRQLVRPMNPKVFPAGRLEKRYHNFGESGHFTSACGGMVYRDDVLFPFGREMQAFTCEPFHNLVHREIVTEDGVSFRANRAAGEEASEFLASEDRWCRPVMVRTGPDGALWVVDMYRYMIEHPQWLPAEGRADLLPHYREGDDKGRIYRVVRNEGTGRRRGVALGGLDTVALASAMDVSNGWQRDKAQQLIVWRKDPAAIPVLRRLARESKRAETRLQALATLDGLDALTENPVVEALHDPHPGVRENALRWAEKWQSPELVAAAVQRISDVDPKVRLQLALTLGEWSHPMAGEALGRLAVSGSDWDDPYRVAAVLSSATKHLRPLVQAIASAGGKALEVYGESLLQMSLALGERATIAVLLEPTLGIRERRYSVEPFAIGRRFLEALSRKGTDWERLRSAGAPDDALSRLLARIPALWSDAESALADAQLAPEDRILAAALLSQDPSRRALALRSMAGWLTPQSPVEVQIAAMRALAATGDREVPTMLLSGWRGYGPAVRSIVSGLLVARVEWALALLGGVESGLVERASLDATIWTRLMNHANREIRNRAESISGGKASSRAVVVEAYKPALALRGDASRGANTFAKICVTCHRRDGVGNEVGPDLASVASHPPEKLLTNILDPSADVQPGFHAYQCRLKTGEEFYGIIAAETGSSLVLKLLDGATRTILRGDIEELRGGGLSLMPDGLESGLSLQDVADLIALLRQPPPRRL